MASLVVDEPVVVVQPPPIKVVVAQPRLVKACVQPLPTLEECSEEVAKLAENQEKVMADTVMKAHVERNTRSATTFAKKTISRLDDETRLLYINELAVEVAFESVTMMGLKQLRDLIRRRARKEGVTVYVDDLVAIVDGVINVQLGLIGMAERWATSRDQLDRITRLQKLASGELLPKESNFLGKLWGATTNAAAGLCAPVIGAEAVQLERSAPLK
jgi:hypothetical protein